MRNVLLAAGCMALMLAGSAHADLVFQIGANNNFSGSGSPTGPFGTVSLVDGTGAGKNGIPIGTVQVSLTLAPNVFANTGAADSFEFSLNGNPTITTANISNLLFTGVGVTSSSGYTLDTNPSIPHAASVTGFGLGINCSACGNGTSPPRYNALTFDITDAAGLQATDFVSGDTAGYYFLADIGIPQAGGGFSTGYSGATGPGTCTNCGPGGTSGGGPVPEPASLALLGGGLAALAAIRRRHSR